MTASCVRENLQARPTSPVVTSTKQEKCRTAVTTGCEVDDRDSVIHARRLVNHTSFEDANHAPSVSVAEGIDVIATAGDTVTLTATGEEHDGDELTYRW